MKANSPMRLVPLMSRLGSELSVMFVSLIDLVIVLSNKLGPWAMARMATHVFPRVMRSYDTTSRYPRRLMCLLLSVRSMLTLLLIVIVMILLLTPMMLLIIRMSTCSLCPCFTLLLLLLRIIRSLLRWV